eukprot:SAG31_NODE_1825_length_7188_cov_5.401326_2_plen_97_part_00
MALNFIALCGQVTERPKNLNLHPVVFLLSFVVFVRLKLPVLLLSFFFFFGLVWFLFFAVCRLPFAFFFIKRGSPQRSSVSFGVSGQYGRSMMTVAA